MSGKRQIRTIVVAGGGVTGLSAAVAFARALPLTRVTVLETLADAGALADVLPTAWPSVARFHARIGLDEHELVRSGIVIHHLGTIFENWSVDGAPWVHAFGNYGKPVGAIPFDQVWCRARASGDAFAFDLYSVGAALARAGKFVHPTADPDSIGSRFQYGLRIDPDRYRERLKSQAIDCDVTIIRAEVGKVRVAEEGGIEALELADGSTIEGDLFIDATGPSARLISSVENAFEDWNAWMPFDRILLRNEPSADVSVTTDHVRATNEGWTIRWPLNGRTLRAELRMGGDGTAIVRRRRLRPWVRNVLAVGDAAIALDPLHGMNLDVAQQLILLALELLPGRGFSAVETDEYNRRAEQLTRRVRDFLALHYLCSGRTSGRWTMSEVVPPDSLARTLDQYRYRGRLPFFEDESLTRDDWTAVLLGIGVMPLHPDPQALGVPLDKAIHAMRRLAREIEQAVASVPSYVDYMRRLTA